jgi:Spy/CpxP family protein refolding chaperone
VRRTALAGFVVALALAGSGAGAQSPPPVSPGHGHQHGHGHHHGAGQESDAHRRVDAYLKEFDAVVADGRGFGLAFAADQHGYPGPLHVLELKDRLHLTAEQETHTRTLFDAMLAQARPRAARLAAAEARLRRLFAAGTADEAAVRAAVAETETARAELRLAHLTAHLATREILTETQRRTYHELRWGSPRHP